MLPKKLTQKSEAVQLLRLEFKLGKITEDMDPKSVWESEDLCKEHKLNYFPTCFYNIKKDYFDGTPLFPFLILLIFLSFLNTFMIFY